MLRLSVNSLRPVYSGWFHASDSTLDLELLCLICIEDTVEHVTRVRTSSTLDSEETTAVQASYFVFVFC